MNLRHEEQDNLFFEIENWLISAENNFAMTMTNGLFFDRHVLGFPCFPFLTYPGIRPGFCRSR